jgi:hypothetical protein
MKNEAGEEAVNQPASNKKRRKRRHLMNKSCDTFFATMEVECLMCVPLDCEAVRLCP